MIIKLFNVFCAVVLISGCTLKDNSRSNTHTNENLIEIEIDNLPAGKAISYSSIFKSFRLLPLETNENCLIGRINQLEVYNDTLYILDSNIAKALFVFDSKGNFIREIGTTGKGPGEFTTPKSFSIDCINNQINILDRKKIIKFSLNGKFINEIALNPSDAPTFIANLEGVTYLDHISYQGRDSNYILSAIDQNGNILKKWFPDQLNMKELKQPVNTPNELRKSINDIKFTKPLMNIIFRIKNKSIEPYIVLNTQNIITDSELESLNRNKDIRQVTNTIMCGKKFAGVQNYLECPNLTMIKFQNYGITNKLFIWHKENKIENTKRKVVDDLTYRTGSRQFHSTYQNYFISSISNDFGQLNELIEDIKSKKIALPKQELFKLDTLNPNSNPVIIFYECRESLKRDNDD